MYSLVLMSALAPGADVTPAAPLAYATPISYGCSGIASLGCTGYGGCSGTMVSYGCSGSCYGSCHGGLFSGMRGHGLFGHKRSCHGCDGGYSCSGWSCFGSCNGGCSGSCHGGSTWGPPIGMPPYTLHGYGYGCGGCYGAGAPVVYGSSYSSPQVIYGTVTNVNPTPAVVIPTETKKDDTKKDDTKKDDTKKNMGANIKFRLPADAKLFVDGRLTSLTGTERAFTTPPLAQGKFFYDVKAELVVDGQPVVEEMRVVVEAGATLTESFPKLLAAAAAKGDSVAGK